MSVSEIRGTRISLLSARSVCHSGRAAIAARAGIHNQRQWLWIPGSRAEPVPGQREALIRVPAPRNDESEFTRVGIRSCGLDSRFRGNERTLRSGRRLSPLRRHSCGRQRGAPATDHAWFGSLSTGRPSLCNFQRSTNALRSSLPRSLRGRSLLRKMRFGALNVGSLLAQ